MYLSFLIILACLFSTYGLDCESPPNCTAAPFNYTLVLNISSSVLAYDKGVNHVLENENVTFTATANSNYDNSSKFTDIIKQSPFYFKFQYRNISFRGEWDSLECVKAKSSATMEHRWNFGGKVEFLAELVAQDNTTLACNSTIIQIAVETARYCDVDVNFYQENHDKERSSAYAIGNITFTSNVNLYRAPTESFLLLHYSFGDKSDDTTNIKRDYSIISENYTHNYTSVCKNCSFEITAIAANFFETRYCRSEHKRISVIMPVTLNNSVITVNSGKKLYKDHSAKLEISSSATLPLTVCWHLYSAIEKHNDSTSSDCALMPRYETKCQNVSSLSEFDGSIKLSDSGAYTLMTSLENNANCTIKNYSLNVDTLPVSAGEVAGGIIGIVVSCFIVVLLILWAFMYIQYRRYKNRHIETAKFNFVILPPINTDSRWARFKMACRRRWYKLTGRRFKEGLVSTINASGQHMYDNSYSSTVSYGTLLQNECSENQKDLQVSVLQDYVSSGYHDDDR